MKEISIWFIHRYCTVFYLYFGLGWKEMSVNLMEIVLAIFMPGHYLFFYEFCSYSTLFRDNMKKKMKKYQFISSGSMDHKTCSLYIDDTTPCRDDSYQTYRKTV